MKRCARGFLLWGGVTLAALLGGWLLGAWGPGSEAASGLESRDRSRTAGEPVAAAAADSARAPVRAAAGDRTAGSGSPEPGPGATPGRLLDAPSLQALEGESSRMQALRDLAAREPVAFDALVDELLGDSGSAELQVPALRVLWELGPRRAAPYWLAAIRELPDEPRAGGVGVPAFAIRSLGERAGRSEVARVCLSRALFESSPPLSSERRLQAVRVLAGATSPRDWPELRARLVSESDEGLRRSAAVAYAAGGEDRPSAEDVLGELGL